MGPEVKPALFYILAFFTIICSILVVRVRNIFYAALCLGLSFFGVAGIYLSLNADFLAGMQILIYVGAIIVVILFAVMLTTGIQKAESKSFNKLELLSFVGATSAAIIVSFIIIKSEWMVRLVKAEPFSIRAIGDTLLRQYLLPFELISVLLLAALIGAIVIAKRDDAGVKAAGTKEEAL